MSTALTRLGVVRASAVTAGLPPAFWRPPAAMRRAALALALGIPSSATPASAHLLATTATTETTISFALGGSDRRAIVVNLPPAGERRPAVLVLHGGMGSAEDMRSRSGFDAVARKNGFIAVYPEGTEFGSGFHAWNTGHLLRRQVRDSDDVAFLDGVIDRLIATHGADPSRIFMTGGSNGGMMTFVYAAQRAERLAAIAPVVASMFTFEVSPEVPLPILIVNGAKDEEVPLEGGMSRNPIVRGAQSSPYKPLDEVVAFWVRTNRSNPVGRKVVEGTVTTTIHDAGPDGAATEFVVDSAGGHGWPGSRARRGENRPIASFRGAERVWEFFADKSRAKPTPRPESRAAASMEPEVIVFPELVDARRGTSGRRVPIKVHLPRGTGPFPVIVVSHGAGGSWDSHFAQARDLASHGYAVLCLEHLGSSSGRLREGARPRLRPMKTIEAMTRDADEVLARPRDVSYAIDRAAEWNESHEKLKGRLDLRRIGVMGHSFGAYTTMVACGMRPALDWLTPRVEPGRGLGPDLSDPRVKCGVALSPQSPGEPFFLDESFASLRVPLLGISGSKDVQQSGRTPEQRRDAFRLWPKGEHRFVWIANANHLDFADSSGSDDRALRSATRDEVQPIVRAATRAFLDLHLKSDPEAAKRITVDGLKPLLRGEADEVEILTK